MTALRILVTGSRNWTDRDAIARALFDALAAYAREAIREMPVLVHGGARGADTIADQVWRERMLWAELADPEIHRADWERYGRRAGMVRNAEMVNAGATVCLAFPLGDSPGTRGCIRLAEKAGIPVVVHEGVPAHDRQR